MRASLVLVALLVAAPATAVAQTDAGTPSTPEAGTSLSPSAVAAESEADSLGPIDQTSVAVERAEDWLADGQRRDAIRHGIVDGYYAELGRGMRSSFHPDLVAIEAERRRGMSLPELALDELSRYGPPEAPRGPSAVYTPELRAATGDDQLMGQATDPGSVAQTQQQFEIQSLLNAHTRWTRVEVHVLQDRSGHVTSATVSQTSGSRTLDAAALAAVTSTAVTSPPPGVLGERQTIESDWSFWAGEVVPYMGQVGCLEGPDGQGLQCTGLGRPILRTRVVLLDVHDAEHERRRRPTTEHRERRHREHPRTELPAPTAPGHPTHDVVPEMPTHAFAPP